MMGVRARLAMGLTVCAVMFATPQAAAQSSDLCASVEGLCAPVHHATEASFRAAIGLAAAARLDTARDALGSGPEARARDSLIAGALRQGATIGPDQSNRVDLGLALGNSSDAAPAPPPDTSRFGPRGAEQGALERGLAGTQERLGSNRQRMGSGAAGAARGMIPEAGIPSLGSLASDGVASRPSVVSDNSKPNDRGGVDRVVRMSDGTEVFTQTGVNDDGSSYIQTDTHRANGEHQRELSYYDADGDYLYSTFSYRANDTSAYTHVVRESFDGGDTWQTIAERRGVGFQPLNAYGPNPRPAPTNVDPDAQGRGGTNPCVLANPDCNVPLIIRFHRNRPDRRGRPDEEAGGTVPRLAPNIRGNVINPSPVDGAVSPGSQAPPTARSQDGGALVNPGRDPK